MRLFYNILLHILFAALFPFMAALFPFLRKRKGTLFARLGFQDIGAQDAGEQARRPIWIHALSVGEVNSAVPLATKLKNDCPKRPILFSATTRTGFELASERLGGIAQGVFYFCYDLPFSINRLLDRVNPSIVVIVESDIWPNFMAAVQKRGIPAILVNARLSDRTFAGYRRFSRLMVPALCAFCRICAQTADDAKRFVALGLPEEKVKAMGNIKLDEAPVRLSDGEKARVRQELGICADIPLVVAGSTHPGEEEVVARAFSDVLRSVGGISLVVAPRDPARAASVKKIFGDAGMGAVTLAEVGDEGRSNEVVVIDRIGLLKRVYAAGDIAFVGGSLGKFGGHNPIEPAVCGLPVLFGPHMDDFTDIARMLVAGGGARVVASVSELSDAIVELASDSDARRRMGDAALQVVEKNRGALDRTARFVLEAAEEEGTNRIAAPGDGVAEGLRALLAPLSLPYGAAAWLRRRLYMGGFIPPRRLPCPVVSVGNLTTGGTGKTPMTVYVAAMLKRAGLSPMVVSRGYKGKASADGGIVSDGETVLMDAQQAGDEPFMMAQLLPGVPVVVGRKRYDAAMRAIYAFSPDVVILDDGFQHFQLARDLDIVLMDGERPLGNGLPLPAGPMREPLSSLGCADLLVFTRTERLDANNPSIRRVLGVWGEKPLFTARHAPVIKSWVKGSAGRGLQPGSCNSSSIYGKRVFVFSGIAQNRRFLSGVASLGARPVGTLFFKDHHKYKQRDFARISQKARETGAQLLVTTGKDYAKIAGRFETELDIVVLDVEIVFDEKQAKAFEQLVVSRAMGKRADLL